MKKLLLLISPLLFSLSCQSTACLYVFDGFEFIAGENKRPCIAKCTYSLMEASTSHKKMGYRDAFSELTETEMFEKAQNFCKAAYEDKKCWF